VIDDATGTPTTLARGVAPVAIRTARKPRIGDVEDLAALTTCKQQRWGGGALDQFEALECMARVDVKRRDSVHADAVAGDHHSLKLEP
jgi:hypothetical protein